LGSVSSSRVVYCTLMTRRHAVVQFVYVRARIIVRGSDSK
jgi:hypothetical protein